ncbi:MAG: hypothetical protein ABIF77_04750 [bacterium]
MSGNCHQQGGATGYHCHRIHNSAEPAHGLQVVQLEEMWRAGGEDSDVIFGHIFGAEADADGKELARCWSRETVLDFTNSVIREADILEVTMIGSMPGPDGQVYIASDRMQYDICVHDTEGKMTRVIQRGGGQRGRGGVGGYGGCRLPGAAVAT